MVSTYFSPYGLKALKDGPKGEFLPDRLTDEAIAYIESHRDEPFLVHMSYYMVHCLAEGKLEAEPEVIAKYQGKEGEGRQDDPTYAAMVESVDINVGRLLDKLDELGLAENTLVVFTSDNGGWGPGTDSAPLRGQKGMVYEGGIRVPLIVRWPGKIEPATTSDAPTINQDLYPTFLEAARVAAPEGQPLDGLSMMPILTGKAEGFDRDAIYWHFPAYHQALAGQQNARHAVHHHPRLRDASGGLEADRVLRG